MYAVLCDPADGAALWALDRLRARLGRVMLVHLDALAFSPAAEWRIGPQGVRASVALPGGQVFEPGIVRAVLNRAHRPPRPAVTGSDAAYAQEEMAALSIALLAAFGSAAVNAPHPLSLAGRDPGMPGWLHLAALAGLPTMPWRMEDEQGLRPMPPPARHALLVGDAVFGLEPALAAPARAMARLLGLDLLGLDLAEDGRVMGATALPDLSLGGASGADALAALLQARGT